MLGMSNINQVKREERGSMDREAHLRLCIDCLVHGPLSLVWMLNTLHRHLKKVDTNKYIESFEYRCHRPLVVRQPLVVGGKQRSDNFGDYDIWVLDAEGKVAVHGVAAVGFSL